MAVFVSKKALEKVPESFTTSQIPEGRAILRSRLFRNSSFFNNLARNAQNAKELKVNDQGDNVRLLQVALKVVRTEQTDVQSDLRLDGIFGPITEGELSAAQTAFGLDQTGILNAVTLLKIDEELLAPTVYNLMDGTVYQQSKYVSDTIDGIITLEIQGLDDVFSVIPGALPISELSLPNQPVFTKITPLRTIANTTMVKVSKDIFTNSAVSQNVLFFDNERGLIPKVPSGLPPGSLARQIGPDDTLMSIIFEEYFKDAFTLYTIPGDNTSAPVFEFPARTLSVEDPDYRIRFYANLIYYLNQDPGISYAIHKTNSSAEDYTDAHLDEVNIYDNNTLGLNYQVFLDKIETLNPNYKIDPITTPAYTVNGETYTVDLPFALDVGENLYLPSREFAEALYCQLNMRPFEGDFYQENTTDENQDYDWIDDDANGFQAFIGRVQAEVTEAVNVVVDTYEEIYGFLTSGFSWLLNVIEEYWPRTLGVQNSQNISIGLLFGIESGGESYVWRELTKKNEFVLRSNYAKTLGVAAEIGIGASFDLGKQKGKTRNNGSGKGTKRILPFDIGWEAGVSGNVQVEIYKELVLPINPDNPELITTLISLISFIGKSGPTTLQQEQVLSLVMNFLSVLNIDSDDYTEKFAIELSYNRFIGASITLDTQALGNANDYGKNGNGNYNVTNENVDDLSLSSIPNLLRKLNFSFGGSINDSLGAGLEFEFDYKLKSRAYKLEGRMPKEVTISVMGLSQRFGGSFATANNLISRMLNKFGLLNSTFDFMNDLNFDQGHGIEAQLVYTRDTAADQHNYADYQLNTTYNDPNNDLDFRLAFSNFSGDGNAPLQSSSEIKYRIDLEQLASTLIQLGSLELPDLDDFLTIFYAIELKKRFNLIEVGINADAKANRRIKSLRKNTDNLRDKRYRTKKGETTFKRFTKSFDITSDDGFTVESTFVSTLLLSAIFKMNNAVNALKYLVLRLRFLASETAFTSQAQKDYYKQIKEDIDSAFLGRFFTVDSTLPLTEGFFEPLINDPSTGILALMDLDENGASTINPAWPWKSNAATAIELLNLFSVRETLDAVTNAVDDLREEPLQKLKQKAQALFPVLDKILTVLLFQTETSLKVNSGGQITGGFSLDIKAGARFNITAQAGMGFFDEILILDKGRQNLRNILNDEGFTDYIENMLRELADSTVVPDFTTSDIIGGTVAQLLLEKTYEQAK